MRKRLQKLLGDKQADQLILGKLELLEKLCTYTDLGTFHATCVKYLRRYVKLINLSNNFVIADAEDWYVYIFRRIITIDIILNHN